MDEQRMYRQDADIYDKIYHEKDYAADAEKITEIITEHDPDAQTLLEAACGTGEHLRFLKDEYDCTGFDINEGMVSVARKKHPNTPIHAADMTSFDLEEQFDAITCLFSSIGYVKTEENLQRTIARFEKHLAPGGVVIIEPWLSRDVFEQGRPHMLTYEDDDLKIARLSVSKQKGEDVSVLEFHWLIARRNEEVEYFTDRHEAAMFTKQQFLDAFEKAGLDGTFIPEGLSERGLYIATKPQ